MTTRAQAARLRASLIGLVRAGGQTLDSLFAIQPRQALTTSMTPLLMPYIDLAAITTADWYDGLAPESGYRVLDEHDVNEERINYTAEWVFNQPGHELPADRMIGAFQRMIFDASRRVVISNAKNEGVPWYRDALADACSFCRLLTVDPQAYQGKYVDMPSHNHDCRCLAVVSRPGNPYKPPEYVGDWEREVRRERTGDLTATLAEMDRNAV